MITKAKIHLAVLKLSSAQRSSAQRSGVGEVMMIMIKSWVETQLVRNESWVEMTSGLNDVQNYKTNLKRI